MILPCLAEVCRSKEGGSSRFRGGGLSDAWLGRRGGDIVTNDCDIDTDYLDPDPHIKYNRLTPTFFENKQEAGAVKNARRESYIIYLTVFW